MISGPPLGPRILWKLPAVLTLHTQSVRGGYIGFPLGAKYIPYTDMDPLGFS